MTQSLDGTVEAHNAGPAAVWSAGGADYDDVSRHVESALAHCVDRLNPKPGDRVLDVATGTGLTARLLARSGANVVGVDIAEDLLAAARAHARRAGIPSEYVVGDAERLPFDDGTFDGVTSTFGVMFASRPEMAAAEIARVCKSGGRIALTTWLPESTVVRMFAVMRPYMPAPPTPPPASPFAWGHRDRIRELFGERFHLRFEEGTAYHYAPDAAVVWQLFVRGYGPTKMLAAGLDADRRAALERDFIAFTNGYTTELGVALPREYLLTVGVRT